MEDDKRSDDVKVGDAAKDEGPLEQPCHERGDGIFVAAQDGHNAQHDGADADPGVDVEDVVGLEEVVELRVWENGTKWVRG